MISILLPILATVMAAGKRLAPFARYQANVGAEGRWDNNEPTIAGTGSTPTGDGAVYSVWVNTEPTI